MQGSDFACRKRSQHPKNTQKKEILVNTSTLALITAAAFILALPAARAQDYKQAAAQATKSPGPVKPWKFVRGVGRVLDLGKLPVVIDEPGLYAIQQDWFIPEGTTGEAIRITADRVILDLHEFRIGTNGDNGVPFTLLSISGASAEIRHGNIGVCCEATQAVAAVGNGAYLHHLSIGSHAAMSFEGDHATIKDSILFSRTGIQLAGSSSLERNVIRGDFSCVTLMGDMNRITDNRIVPYIDNCLEIRGNGNLVANNVIDTSNVADLFYAFDVEGDHNIVRNNTVLVGHGVHTVLRISGTANTLDGNIGASVENGSWPSQARTGLEFTVDGNYYGNNRLAAEVPFALGGTVQTDWGGNVGY
jgi:hypothetical protein